MQSSERRLGYIKPRCANLEVVSYRDVGDTRYIEVRCRLGYITEYGCPISCPGYRESRTSGALTLAGVLLGGGIGGLLGGSLSVIAGAIIGGLLGLVCESAITSTQLEQLIQKAQPRKMRVTIVVKHSK